jgi:hypothetical protein
VSAVVGAVARAARAVRWYVGAVLRTSDRGTGPGCC